jgi:hypothetical protein
MAGSAIDRLNFSFEGGTDDRFFDRQIRQRQPKYI